MVGARTAKRQAEDGSSNGASGSKHVPFQAADPRARTVVNVLHPLVSGGKRAAKAAVGQRLGFEAEAFADGHDVIRCELRYRHADNAKWSLRTMESIGNDRWYTEVPIATVGLHRFVVRAAVDPYATWLRDLLLRHQAGQVIAAELAVGAHLVANVGVRTKGQSRQILLAVTDALATGQRGLESLSSGPDGLWQDSTLEELVSAPWLLDLMAANADPAAVTASPMLSVFADPALARCSAWYELFPRSASGAADRHGTFADVRLRLDDIERMGFDVLYLPPIHPIGTTGRKGRDGTPLAATGDTGSPWAIGGAEGGHCAIHPQLGSLEEFKDLVADAAARHIAVALDLAFQASPDHPWVREHPEWFRHRPDGSIRYAENPPKTYEDIYPLDFETEDWQALWIELLNVVLFWIGHGVSVFRVDNPHTKPFAFWEWLIRSVKETHPEVLFLAEAFTRPAVMEELAKAGFSQSYTYFTWRTTKWDLETYLHELEEMADYFRPSFWPNTPDILSTELQEGGRAVFAARLILAATLSPNYGIYGPAFELQEHVARSPGSEEYRRSEKYEIRGWETDRPDSLSDLVGQMNAIRRQHPALQHGDGLHFHRAENDLIMAYSKRRVANGDADTTDDIVLVIVSLDHHNEQTAWIDLDLDALGLDPVRPFVVHDLLDDSHYQWRGSRNFIILNPDRPAHVFAIGHQTPAGLST
jgi:starch synthase (maltosyl-transferring)